MTNAQKLLTDNNFLPAPLQLKMVPLFTAVNLVIEQKALEWSQLITAIIANVSIYKIPIILSLQLIIVVGDRLITIAPIRTRKRLVGAIPGTQVQLDWDPCCIAHAFATSPVTCIASWGQTHPRHPAGRNCRPPIGQNPPCQRKCWQPPCHLPRHTLVGHSRS